MIGVEQEVDLYLASFAGLEKKPAQAPRWIQRLRETAMERFAHLGLPTGRLEDWKFTSVAPIAKIPFQPSRYEPNGLTASRLAQAPLADLGCPRLVFVNGFFSRELSSPASLPQGVHVASLAEALEGGFSAVEEHLARYARYEDHAFVALNTALLRDGAFVQIPKGVVIETPIHLLFLVTATSQPLISHPRNLFLVGRGSQVSFIETYLALTDEVYFTNTVTEVVVGEDAVVDHYKLQRESPKSFHVATLQAQQERSSTFTSHNISLGGALVRNDINSVLNAEGAECTLNGLYLAAGHRHVDNHTALDHVKPHCSSREVYKGILDGKATAVFNGKIIVRKDAQKTDAKQTNKNLLLSDHASINTKPQLEIYADDVKCTHGATVGQLGEEAIFYLRSRGISHSDARSMLTHAFASELFARMRFELLRAGLDGLLLSQLRKPV